VLDFSGSMESKLATLKQAVVDALLTHESLHDARLELSGVEVSDTTDFDMGKVYRGQQLVVFGRYAAGGVADVQLHSRLSNRDKTYSARVAFPDVADGNPELERLWALDSIHALQKQALLGLLPQAEARHAAGQSSLSERPPLTKQARGP
jgi:Ca-activated chloride channel homolog